MRHLIVCCDGTWNTTGALDATTNVRRLHNALAETAEDGAKQLRYYHSGVGAGGGLTDWIMGGITGAGLSRNVLDAYQWLTTNYQKGDRIALFGFSRGAYTVRSVAGMVASCGLIDITCRAESAIRRAIEHIYQCKYKMGQKADPLWRDGLSFSFDPENADQIPVHFIGVWETVGALGIPNYLGGLNLLDSPRRYAFHDVRLNPHVRFARHALAMDEGHVQFTPTLWSDPALGQDVEQVWFPGSHLDVGGGYLQTGLSDGALQWMIEQATKTIGLGFQPKMIADQISPDPRGDLHDLTLSALGLLGPALEPMLEPFLPRRPRAVPRIDPDAESRSLDRSVYERHENPPITGAPYRRTQVLAAGESMTVRVVAHEPWNETGVYLEAGHYRFAAQGEWVDGNIRSGPAGSTGLRRFLPAEARQLGGTLIGVGVQLFRRVSGNNVAEAIFSRRELDLPWMSLVGVVANDAIAIGAGQYQHERIAIGAGAEHQVCRDGYLYAYANDAWGRYSNNWGDVSLTVTRMA
ncbi:MAG TPA: DUF2235 domain-containing protein [Pseudonocardiaceae bacterium]